MAPNFEIKVQEGALVADYHPAAMLSTCILQRNDTQIGNQQSSFTAKILVCDSFWIQKSTHLILYLKDAFWWWPILAITLTADSVIGVVLGDPIVKQSLPSFLKEVQK